MTTVIMDTIVDMAHKEESQLKWLQEQEKKFKSYQDSEYHRREEVAIKGEWLFCSQLTCVIIQMSQQKKQQMI